ncbi:MAG: Na+/H+ antiporter NhaA [Actinomadura sp.]
MQAFACRSAGNAWVMPRHVAAVFPFRPTVRYSRNLAEALRTETVGGLIMLAATMAALIWADTPWAGSYEALRNAHVGPAALHLDLSLLDWAADGLLAIFFFIAGLELREELTHGELRNRRDAALPIFAAVAGVAVPAAIYLLVSAGEPGALRGWAVPTATDIAFALAVLAVTFSACPTALRAFLLTLAVVDDLIAITIIAILYTDKLDLRSLLAAVALIALYGSLQALDVRAPWIHIPIAVFVWYLVHGSGVHATVAGVTLGLLTSPREAAGGRRTNAEQADHMLRPISAGLCVPIFAFLAAGVALTPSALTGLFTDRVALGVIAALVIGKFVGVLGGAWVATRLGFARLGEELNWRDLAGVATLAGVGFTVSLLIGDLAYAGADRSERVTTAVLGASLIASVSAAVIFRIRGRRRVRRVQGRRRTR